MTDGGRFDALKDLKNRGRNIDGEPEPTPAPVAAPAYVPPEELCMLGAQVPVSVKLAFDQAVLEVRARPGARKTEARTALAELVRMATEDPDFKERWLARVQAAGRR